MSKQSVKPYPSTKASIAARRLDQLAKQQADTVFDALSVEPNDQHTSPITDLSKELLVAQTVLAEKLHDLRNRIHSVLCPMSENDGQTLHPASSEDTSVMEDYFQECIWRTNSFISVVDDIINRLRL